MDCSNYVFRCDYPYFYPNNSDVQEIKNIFSLNDTNITEEQCLYDEIMEIEPNIYSQLEFDGHFINIQHNDCYMDEISTVSFYIDCLNLK